MLLVHFLRDQLGLTGTHWGCDTSNCGTCVVTVDGEPVKSCTMLAAMASGHDVRTVEGLEVDGELDPVQEGFMQCHGLQCGFCTPGMMMTARALLDRNPDPDEATIREAISGSDLPVHRLHHDRAVDAVGGRTSAGCRGRTGARHGDFDAQVQQDETRGGEAAEPMLESARDHREGQTAASYPDPTPPTRRQRPEALRARPDAPQGGPAVHPRPRHLRRRHPVCPACCTWPSCASPVRTPASCASTPLRRRHIRR